MFRHNVCAGRLGHVTCNGERTFARRLSNARFDTLDGSFCKTTLVYLSMFPTIITLLSLGQRHISFSIKLSKSEGKLEKSEGTKYPSKKFRRLLADF